MPRCCIFGVEGPLALSKLLSFVVWCFLREIQLGWISQHAGRECRLWRESSTCDIDLTASRACKTLNALHPHG